MLGWGPAMTTRLIVPAGRLTKDFSARSGVVTASVLAPGWITGAGQRTRTRITSAAPHDWIGCAPRATESVRRLLLVPVSALRRNQDPRHPSGQPVALLGLRSLRPTRPARPTATPTRQRADNWPP